mgnify:CR=1 FL=1
MTVGRSRLYPCSSGPPAPRNGSKPLRKAKSALEAENGYLGTPCGARSPADVQTSIRPGLKSSCSVIRIDAARYYSASLRLQQIFDAAAKRAGQSEHGGDGSFAKVFAALLVHLDGAQGNAGAAGQPGLAESGAHADRVQPGVALGAIMAARSSYTSTNRLSSASCRVGCSRTISSSDSTSRMSENRTPLAHWQYASTHPAQYSGVEPARSALAAYRECAPNRFAA